MDKLELVAKKIMLNVDSQVSEDLTKDWKSFQRKIETLKTLDTSDVEPMVRIYEKSDHELREDTVEDGLNIDIIIKNSASTKGNFILVPKVVNDD